jgi:hypothetical protein
MLDAKSIICLLRALPHAQPDTLLLQKETMSCEDEAQARQVRVLIVDDAEMIRRTDGASELLDKSEFFDELIPAILDNRSDENDAVSVEFVYSEDDRFYYRIAVVSPQHEDWVFNVWISSKQELQFGSGAQLKEICHLGSAKQL